MSPSAYIALARDLFIVAVLAFLGYRIYTDGQNAVKVHDVQALQKQLQENAQHAAQYAQQSQQADEQRQKDLAQVNAAIAANSAPVWLYRPSGANSVSRAPSCPSVQPAAGGSVDSGPRVDIRADISAFEQRYETALADCRDAIAKWPTPVIVPK